MNGAMPATGLGEPPAPARFRRVPFDYSFEYDLEGVQGRVHNATVTVSIEGPFVAVSIGYGFVPKVTPIDFGVIRPTRKVPPKKPRQVTLAGVFAGLLTARFAKQAEKKKPEKQVRPSFERQENFLVPALRAGIRINPAVSDAAVISLFSKTPPTDPSVLRRLFRLVEPAPDQVQFLYAIYDEGAGREFQSEMILNTAGLGTSNGDRPFRYFARPITFTPRTTIRMQVQEVSEFPGRLHVALHGYKVLGIAGSPTSRRRRRHATRGGGRR